MRKFVKHHGIAASFPQHNIDTDAVIPASYQRSLSEDMGKGLFAGWRYDLDGKEVPDFILNQEPFRDASIIVGGVNFGCGSSREAAVYALMQFGIRCVIAPSFGDIFFENSFKNGLLTVVLPEAQVTEINDYLSQANDPRLLVDLEACVVELGNGKKIGFEIPPAKREALLQGLDEIGQTLQHDKAISSFQKEASERFSWIYEPRLTDQLQPGE